MATTIGSLDLASLKNLRDDLTQYFWFESSSSSAWGSGAHVTLYPESQFTDSTNPNYMKGQNIIMNTDGFSIRNGGLPMMTLSNNSLDFNVINTTEGTYTKTARFTATGAQIGQSSGAHSVIDADGQRFYAIDGTTLLSNIGYGEGNSQTGTSVAPYYVFGTTDSAVRLYDPNATYDVGDVCLYGDPQQLYVCMRKISVAEAWNSSHWRLARGNYSCAEGYDTIASGFGSHAEGGSMILVEDGVELELKTMAHGFYSHAEGQHAIATGSSSHAEGCSTTASGYYCHAEGYSTIASGDYSHAQNWGTRAYRRSQTVIGEYNEIDSTGTTTSRGKYALIIGNGNSVVYSNALTVDWDGRIGCGDYSGNFKSIFDIFYPKGSYYETSLPSAIPSGSSTPNATDLENLGSTWFDPNYAWGGTWVLELEGQVHVSAGSNYSVAGALTNGTDGGSKYIQAHTHANSLTLPNHTHGTGGTASDGTDRFITMGSGDGWGAGRRTIKNGTGTSLAGNFYNEDHPMSRKAATGNPNSNPAIGGSIGAVSGATTGTAGNMPPYIVVNRWHRTA